MLLKHPQALGREEAASLEGTQRWNFCQDTSWLSCCQVTGILLGTRLSLLTHSVIKSGFSPSITDPRPGFIARLNSSRFPTGAGTEQSPLPSPQGPQPFPATSASGTFPFKPLRSAVLGGCVPSRRDKKMIQPTLIPSCPTPGRAKAVPGQKLSCKHSPGHLPKSPFHSTLCSLSMAKILRG